MKNNSIKWKMRFQALWLWYKIWFAVLLIINFFLVDLGVYGDVPAITKFFILSFGTAVAAAVIDVIAYFVPLWISGGIGKVGYAKKLEKMIISGNGVSDEALGFALDRFEKKGGNALDVAAIYADMCEFDKAEEFFLKEKISYDPEMERFESVRFLNLNYYYVGFNIYFGKRNMDKIREMFEGIQKYSEGVTESHPLFIQCLSAKMDMMVLDGQAEKALELPENYKPELALSSNEGNKINSEMLTLFALAVLGDGDRINECLEKVKQYNNEYIVRKCNDVIKAAADFGLK